MNVYLPLQCHTIIVPSDLCELITEENIENFKLLWDVIPQELLRLNGHGFNMLHVAATVNQTEFIRIILDAGADIDETVQGATALFAAAVNRNLPVIKLLVDHNADILLKVDKEYNVIDFAKQANIPEIADFLLNQ